MHKRIRTMLEKICAVMDNATLLGAGGQYPFFSYKDSNVDMVLHQLDDHAHADAITSRPDVFFTTIPPLSMQEYKSQVKGIEESWKGKAGEHEFEGSDNGVSALYSMKTDQAFNEPASIDEGDTCPEAHKTILVVACLKDTSEVVGHIKVTLSASLNAAGKSAFLFYSVHIVWVAPKYRGLGYSSNLSMVAGEICADIFHEIATMLPGSWSMSTVVNADLETEGGEAAVNKVHGELVSTSEMNEYRCEVHEVDLDAGY